MGFNSSDIAGVPRI